jgi:hypothetical protein
MRASLVVRAALITVIATSATSVSAQSYIYRDPIPTGDRVGMIAAGGPTGTSAPSFQNSSASITVDQDSSGNDISALLAANDPDTGEVISWAVETAPSHGYVSGLPAGGVTTGGSVAPTGVDYTPSPSYAGPDAFEVRVVDAGGHADVLTVSVTVEAPTAGDCYDPANVGLEGQPGWNGCEGMLIVDTNMLQLAASPYWSGDGSYAITANGKTYTFAKGGNDIFTGQVYSMRRLFWKDNFAGDISYWDVSNVREFGSMFEESTGGSFTRLDKWDTSSAEDMGRMFAESNFDPGDDVANWDVSNVDNFSMMFYRVGSFNGDVTGWDVSSGKGFANMFTQTSFNRDISTWDVSNANGFSWMFSGSPFNQDISNWDVSNAVNFGGMFAFISWNYDISHWDVSNAYGFGSMFLNNPTFNQDISGWDVSNSGTFGAMFQGAAAFNQPIGSWDVSNSVYFRKMFDGATLFDQDLSGWDVSGAEEPYDLSRMFKGTAMTGDLSSWCVDDIGSRPLDFGPASLTEPVWGTCP